jgi:hypothetical protein
MKKFKLGSEYVIYESDLKNVGQNGASSYYRYDDDDVEALFGHPIDNITLQFYSDQLYKVIFTFFWGKTDNEKLLRDLSEIFGNPSKEFMWTGVGLDENHFEWHGERTYLSLVWDNTATRLTMYSRIIHKRILKDDF